MDSRDELVHLRTRNAFREHCSDAGTVRMVAKVFESEGLDPEPWSERWDAPGQRRGTFDRYTHNVDWSDPRSIRAVLNAFEEIFTWGEGEWADGVREKLRRHLERDGYRLDDRGRIRASALAAAAESLPLEGLTDPSAILEHLERISDYADRDPAQAVSSSKALIEATTKLVLREMNEPFDEKAKMPALIQSAQKALKLHPDLIAPTAPGVVAALATVAGVQVRRCNRLMTASGLAGPSFADPTDRRQTAPV